MASVRRFVKILAAVAAGPALLTAPQIHAVTAGAATTGAHLNVSHHEPAAGTPRADQRSGTGGATPPLQAVPLRSGGFQIKNSRSKKCVEVPKASKKKGVRLDQYTCIKSKDNERWDFQGRGCLPATNCAPYGLLKNYHSKLCMDVNGNGTANGTAVIQWTCSNAKNNFWALTKYHSNDYVLYSYSSNKCGTINGASRANGAKLTIWKCLEHDNQLFK